MKHRTLTPKTVKWIVGKTISQVDIFTIPRGVAYGRKAQDMQRIFFTDGSGVVFVAVATDVDCANEAVYLPKLQMGRK